ncbi:MarR family winged helix-turn-helix transcriptional regulator [Nakamurella endophytica]|uniref:MarR family transcriptional regulator n=1 Tax=Nakamurella endophytica TaxID=1748367 RepID=A0A917T777_9ACTN|nr:MarR family transcriptional regulator [Nakamurella endophytica]GGM13183.1 MarR family transcriptional regulator [Nakamurella endophytica]
MPTTATDVLDMDTVAALRHAVLIISRRMRHQQEGTELSPSEAAVLGRISREGPVTPGALARAEHVQPPSMTRIVERLEARGFIRRDPHPDDRRQVLLRRTPEGEEFIERSRRLRTAWLADHVGRLDADQQRLLAAATPALSALADLP